MSGAAGAHELAAALTWRRRHRTTVIVSALVATLVTAVVVLHWLGSVDGFGSVEGRSGDWAYVWTFLFVVADAICALFPCETVLNAASALAADGRLALGWVMLAGALGAVVGDSSLYWIARLAGPRVQPQLDKALRNEKVKSAFSFLGERAPVLLLVGRYVPGLRFVVNASLGLTAYPYRRFLLWAAIGGSIWSVYTCGLAYLVGTSLAGFPLATVVISATITSIALIVIFLFARRRRTSAA